MKKRYAYRQTLAIGGKIKDVKAKTQEELDEKIKRLRQQAGEIEKPAITVSQWIPQALSLYKPGITHAALRGYLSKCRRHIAPIIGDVPLTSVTPSQCQAVMASMVGYATDTQRKVKQLMIFLFDTAIIGGYTDVNPAVHVTDPQPKPSHVRRVLAELEKQKVIDTIPQDPRYIIFGFMLYCGCRPDEAAKIKYNDIKDGMLHIRGTKTQNADRIVPIPETLTDLIPEADREYIAVDHRGHPLSASSRRRLWLDFRRAAGLSSDIVPYCLRHTYCTDLFRAGVDIRVASRLMGHSSISITNDTYTHIQVDDILDAKNKIDHFSRKKIL